MEGIFFVWEWVLYKVAMDNLNITEKLETLSFQSGSSQERSLSQLQCGVRSGSLHTYKGTCCL